MNIKQAIAQTQKRWLELANGATPLEATHCGFCEKIGQLQHGCAECEVSRFFKVPVCLGVPSLMNWMETDDDTPEEREAARLVLADVNRIAKHYHLRQVEIPR